MSDGIGFSPDGPTLYHSDSTTKGIWAHDVAADGSVANRCHLGPGAFERSIPDGICVDIEGAHQMYIVTAENLHDPGKGGSIFRSRPGVSGVATPLARV